jgi:hypothetical protein
MSALKLEVTSWGVVMLDKKQVRAVMRAAGNDIRSKTARLVNKTQGSGRQYYGGGGAAYRGEYRPGRYRASAPGSPPVRVSGTLRGSLKTYLYPSGEGFAVRERIFYALWQETGASGGGNPGKRALLPINRRTGKRKRAKGVYTRRVLAPRPAIASVIASEAANLNRRVEAALLQGMTWKQTK